MKKFIVSFFLVGAVILSPFVASAATPAELEAQIADLLKTISGLQVQLKEVKNQTPAANNASTEEVDPGIGQCLKLINTLRTGSRDFSTNGEVSKLQQFLYDHGYLTVEPTGYYGPATTRALKAFQVAEGVIQANDSAFYTVGPKTRARIADISCGSGSSDASNKPAITSVTNPVILGQKMSIHGTNLNSSTNFGQVYIDEVAITGVDGSKDGSSLFFILPSLLTGSHRVYVKTDSGVSNTMAFQVHDTSPSVTIVSPNAGDAFRSDQVINITWKAGAPLKLPVLYVVSEGDGGVNRYSRVLTANSEGTVEGFDWRSVKADGKYAIRICDDGANPTYPLSLCSEPRYVYRGSATSAIPTITQAQLLSTSDDRAGIWHNFGPGIGNINKNAADWNWMLTTNATAAKGVKRITIIHNTRGEVWSTGYSRYLSDGTDLYGYEEHPYPLVVRDSIGQINQKYEDQTNVVTGTYSFYLYGQKESATFTGGKVIIEFTDGTSATAVIPAGLTSSNPAEKYLFYISGVRLKDIYTPTERPYFDYLTITEPDQTDGTPSEGFALIATISDADGRVLRNLSTSYVGTKWEGTTDPLALGSYTLNIRAYCTGDASLCVKKYGSTAVVSKQIPIKVVSIYPRVTVISPNGGEQLQEGSQVQIKWETTPSVPAGTPMKISLLDNPTRLGKVIFASTPNDGSETWTVQKLTTLDNFKNDTTVAASGQYVIHISCADTTCTVDDSNYYFTITGSAGSTNTQSVTPSKATVASGESVTLAYGIPSNVVSTKLYLSCPTGISTKTETGSELCNRWTSMSPTVTSTTFTVTNSSSIVQKIVPNFYVYKADNPNYGYGVSSQITVNSATSEGQVPRSIIVRTPNGGEGFVVGKEILIKWTNSNLPSTTTIDDFRFTLVSASGVEYPMPVTKSSLYQGGIVGYVAPNGNSNYSTTIPASVVPGEGYKLHISCTLCGAAPDMSDASFRIIGADKAPTITVTGPGTGTLGIGQSAIATWITSNLKNDALLNIGFYGEANTTLGFVVTSGSGVANTGSYTFTVPATVTPSTYRVQISCANCANDYGYNPMDWGDVVTAARVVMPVVSPSLNVLSPNGGEAIVVGETKRISWESSGLDTVSLYIRTTESKYNTSVHKPIVYNVPASQKYYDFPFLSTSIPYGAYIPLTYKIHIKGFTNDSTIEKVTDESDSEFTVTTNASTLSTIAANAVISGVCTSVSQEYGNFALKTTPGTVRIAGKEETVLASDGLYGGNGTMLLYAAKAASGVVAINGIAQNQESTMSADTSVQVGSVLFDSQGIVSIDNINSACTDYTRPAATSVRQVENSLANIYNAMEELIRVLQSLR